MNRRKSFLLLLIAVSVLVVGSMLAPYTGYLLAGLLLAFVTYPLHRVLRKRAGSSVSAGLVILLTVVAAVLPFVIVLGAVADDASNFLNQLGQTGNFELGETEQRLEELTGQEIDVDSTVRSSLRKLASVVAGSASGAVSLASSIAIGVSLMLFIQFYGLKDGASFVEWTKKFDVVPDRIQQHLYTKTADTTKAVMKGHVLVAVAQGLLAGIGLMAAGIPNVVFWTFVMVLLGFIPMIGTAFVWVPASIYLASTGSVQAALFLLAWGVIVVGGADNFLRPFLVDESADLHPLFVILGVIGGVGVFGVIGIFLGPVMFGVAKSLLEIYIEEYPEL